MLGLVPKILCSLSPLDIPMMLSLLSLLNSPLIHSSLSSFKNSLHLYPPLLPGNAKSQHFWPGPPSRLFQKPAWLSLRCKSPTMSQRHLSSFSWLADFCRQCPHQSGLPDWCIFHSSSLLITPVIGWPGDVSTEANSSKSRQTALFICGYLHFN